MENEIKFVSRVLVSTKEGHIPYHDDMLGENVWISCEKPSFIHSYDWREFNGVPIEKIAAFLQDYEDEKASFDIDMMRKFREVR